MKQIDTSEQAIKTVARGAGVIFAGMFIGYFLAYLTRIVIARWLGPTDYGLLSLGIVVLGIATTLSLVGLTTGSMRHISFFKGKKDFRRIKGTIITALKISLPLSIVLSIIFFLLSEKIAILFFHNADLIPILKVFSIVIPFSVLLEITVSCIQGLQISKYKVYAKDIIFEVLKIGSAMLFILLGYGIFGVVVGWAFSIIVASIVSFYYLEKTFPVIKKKIKANFTKIDLLSFSWPLTFSSFLYLIINWADIMMIGYFKAASDVGMYNAALPTASLLIVIFTAFSFLFTPVMSELFSKKKMEELKKVLKVTARWIFILTFPVFLLMFFFSDSILSILFGEEFILASMSLSILSVGYFFTIITGLSGWLILSMGRTKIILLITSVIAVSNIALNFVLIPIYGITGAAIAMSLSMIFGYALSVIILYRMIGATPYSFSYLKPFFAGIVSCVFLFLINEFLIQGTQALYVMLSFTIFIIIYFILLLVFKTLNQEDMMILRSLERRTGIKINWLRKIIKMSVKVKI